MTRLLLFTLLAAACPAQSGWPYLTYFGGTGSENIRFVSSDGAGGTFVAGETSSIGPPFSDTDPGYTSYSSVFVSRIDAAGQLVFAKVLGEGTASALAVDGAGNAFVSGTIRVAQGFTTAGVFQPEASNAQAFVAKIGPSGEKLFATYFGSLNGVQIGTMVVDAEGRPAFCGSSTGSAAPLTPSTLYQPEGRNYVAFCAQLSADGASLIFSTLLAKPAAARDGITYTSSAALDSEGNLIVAGGTYDGGLGSDFQPGWEDPRRYLFQSRRGEPFQSRLATPFGTVTSVQSAGDEVFVGTANNGAWVSPDGGETWRQLRGAPSGNLVAHPLATRFLCVYFSNAGACSRDGGDTWQLLGVFTGQITLVPDPRVEGGFFVTNTQPFSRPNYVALAASPPPASLPAVPQWVSVDATGDRIFAIVSRDLLFSEDRGATFRKLAENLSTAAVAPSAPNRLYATRAARFSGRDSFLIRSDDGGATWRDTTLNEPFPLVRQLLVDPANPDIVYVVASAAAYRSTDGGASWQLWTPAGLDNIGVQTIYFDDRERMWVGSLQGANGFVVKLKIDKPAILWAKMFSGAGGAFFNNIRVNAAGGIVFSGFTFGTDLPVTGPSLMPRTRGRSGFAGVFEPNGDLVKLRSIGLEATGFDLSADGSIHLAATAVATDLGEVEEVRGSYAGGASDALWLVLSPSLDRVTRATWLGGSGADTASAILAGIDGNLRLVGSTLSKDLPVSKDALQKEFSLFGGESLIGGEGFIAITPR